jgi:hypothetical protein
MGLALMGLAACTSDQLLIASNDKSSAGSAGITPLPDLVAVKSIIGPPDDVRHRLAEQLNAVAARNNIALLVDADAKAPRTLQGNVWLRPDVSGLKLVHVWDVLNDKGERINRVRGEEAIRQAGPATEPWSAITQTQAEVIAVIAISALKGAAAKR